MQVRPVRRDDAPRLEAFFDGLSPETRRLRFLGRAADTRGFADVDQERHVAFVCERDGRIVGDARYLVNPGGESCEFGIVVEDAARGSGAARALMQALIDAARRRGIERMKGLVLAENARMLRFAQSLGFELEAVPDEPDLLRVTRRIQTDHEETARSR